MQEVAAELEAIAKKGGLALTGISLKEGMATLSCNYSGPDLVKVHQMLSSKSALVNANPPRKLEVNPIQEGAFAFTVSLTKLESRGLLTAIKAQALELAARLAALKKRGRPKLPK